MNANGVRLLQFTPPGSGCSIQFGKDLTPAPPGSARNVYLVVDDMDAARAELAGRGVAVSDAFHESSLGGRFQEPGGTERVEGASPESSSYGSFATFSDPDGNTLAPAGGDNPTARTDRRRHDFVCVGAGPGRRHDARREGARRAREANRRGRSGLAHLVRDLHGGRAGRGHPSDVITSTRQAVRADVVLDERVAREVAAVFVVARNEPGDPSVAAAYRSLERQSDRLFRRLTHGDPKWHVRVVFTRCRAPYEHDGEMIAAVRPPGSSRSRPAPRTTAGPTHFSDRSAVAPMTGSVPSMICSGTCGPGVDSIGRASSQPGWPRIASIGDQPVLRWPRSSTPSTACAGRPVRSASTRPRCSRMHLMARARAGLAA